MLTVDTAPNNKTLPQRYRHHSEGEQPLHIQCAVNDCICNITCSRPRQVRLRRLLYFVLFVVVLVRSFILSQKVANEAWHSGQRRDKDVESTVINLLTQPGLLNNVTSLSPLSISPISSPPTSLPTSLPPPLVSPTLLPLPLSALSFLNYTERLPAWFSEYVQFHNEAIQEISRNVSSYVDYNYFILRCVPWDSDGKATCFGASDRLKMIPVMLKLAYQYRRIFFIYWEHPFPIEEFLLPNTNVMNWSLPHYLIERLNPGAVMPLWYFYYDREKGMSEDQKVICTKAMVNGNFHYDDLRFNDTNGVLMDEPPFWEVYSDFWKALFLPSPGVSSRIYDELLKLNLLAETTSDDDNATSISPTHLLVPNIHVRPYISVHVRANLFEDKSDEPLEENAINCAKTMNDQYLNSDYGSMSWLRTTDQDLPVYIASDKEIIVHRAKQFGYNRYQLQVVSRNYTSTPLHIDHPPELSNTNETLQPSDFYDTFVDLYLMAMGQCVTYGMGGFGRWAAAMSYNPTGINLCTSFDHYYGPPCINDAATNEDISEGNATQWTETSTMEKLDVNTTKESELYFEKAPSGNTTQSSDGHEILILDGRNTTQEVI